MWRGLRLVVVLSMCLQLAGMAVGPSSAYAADGAESIAQGIASFGHKLDEMGFLDALGEPIPLTGVSPSDDQALRLYRLFGDSLTDGLAGFSGNLDDLAHRLVIDLSGNYDGVALSFTDVTSATAGSLTDFSFTVTASRADSLPVAYYHEWVEEPRPGVTNTVSLDLSGGGLTPTLQLTGELHFQYDSGADPAFYLAEAPAFDLSVAASGPIQPFGDLFGFTEIEVSDQGLALNDHITVDLVDPDDDGQITPEEWIYTSAADLFAVQRPEAGQPGQGLSATLALEAAPLPGGGGDLLPGSPDGYIELADDDLTNGLAPPVARELGELERLDNVRADDVLAGLASLASGLIAAQGRADAQLPNGRLPYLGNSFSDAFSVAEPLGRFIQQQGDAAILCGTVDSDPPSGEAWRVAAGTTVYCQAITVSDAETVAWAIDPAAGSILANGTVTTTVGPNPETNAAFAVTVEGSLPISVTFTLPTDPEGRSHTVTPRFRSAQELYGKLSAFPGFSLGAGDVAYDPSTTALTYRFGATYDPEPIEGSFDFSDQLQPETGLAGLKATDEAAITLDAGPVALDLTFGTILVDDYDDITPDRPSSGLGDRFFVQVDEEDGEHEVEVPAIAFPAPIVDLEGRVGFVEVSAQGNLPFEILPSGSAPMLAIDFVAPPDGIPIEGHGAIADAILIPELVSDTLTTISPEIHIDVSAGLAVTAEVEDATGDATVALGQGTVTITWTDVAHTAPAIETSDDLVDSLQVYDIQPSLFGTATVTSIEPMTDTLTDTLATFTSDLVGRELRNLTDNSRCLITSIEDEQTLVCAAGLQSGGLNVWQDGDRYEVTGNPTALRDVILDNLYSLAYRTDTITPTSVISDGLYFSSLPLLGQSPFMLATQFDAFKEGIDAVRAGVPDATITCGVDNTVPPSGTLSSLVLDPIDLSDWAYCQAKTATDVAVSGVKWTMTGGEYAGTSHSGQVTATVGISPTANAEFVVTEPAGVQVSVTFTDTHGTHTATYPPRPLPESLQDLEQTLESKLGLPPGGLIVEPLSLEHPTGSETRHLVVRLGQGACTTGHAGCEPGDRVVRKPNLELKVDLGADLPALMGLERTETAQLEYASRAQLDLAFPLSHTLSISDVAVLETSGLSMTMDVSTVGLDMEANVGPLSLAAGLGAALTGTHHLKAVTGEYSATISSTDTLTNTEIWFLRDWGVVAGTTTTITNTTKDEDCQVEAVTEHTITCLGALSNGASWEDGDAFGLVGPSTKVLYHPGANFTAALVDKELTNTDDGSSCTIAEVLDENTLRCAAPLTGGADNRWEDGDGYSAGAVGRIEFGARFQLAKDGITPGGAIDTFSIDDFVGGLRASLERPATTRDCGDGLTGDACARISLRDLNAGEYLGELRLSIADISSPEVRDLAVPQALRDQVQNAAIDFDHLVMGLEALRGSLVVALDGNESDLMLPLVGTTLDAGADVATVLRDDLMAPLGDLGVTLNALPLDTPATDIEPAIQNYLSGAIPNLLGGVDVALICNAGGACGAGEFVYDISDVRLSFTIGNQLTPKKGCADDSCPGGPVDLPFDIGLPGVSLFSDDLAESSFGWRLQLAFGLSRTLGAYVDVGGPDALADLEVGARVVIKGAGCNASIDNPSTQIPDLDVFSDERCMTGQMGLLPVAMRDGVESDDGLSYNDRSYLDMLVSIDLVPASEDGPAVVPVADLADEMVASTSLDADANVDLRFRSTAGFGGGDPAAFPTVLGTFHLAWDGGDPGGDGEPIEELKFSHLYLDPGTFVDMFLEPTVGKVQDVTKPLQPVVDTVTTPLPVISDLSKLGGGGPVTLFTMMNEISGNSLELVERVISFIQFANNLPESGSAFPLGGDGDPYGEFELDVLLARVTGGEITNYRIKGPCYLKPPSVGVRSAYCAYKTYQKYKKIKQELEQEEKAEDQRRQEKEDARKGKQRSQRTSNAKGKMVKDAIKAGLNKHRQVVTSGGFEQAPGISLPFLEDSTQIFYALLGQDVTLVRADFGMVAATVGMYWRFRIQAGPIPVTLIIGGQATLKGRLAMGFDTRGFGPLLAGEAGIESLSGSSLLDGIFLDDFDASGQDVAEIQLIVEVTAGAAVDLVIISVGVEAGLSILFSLDFDNRLHDPPGSGKLRISTIANIHNPVCLFEFRTRGELFFRIFFEINLFLFKKRFSWEPFPRVVLWDESFRCEPPTPILGHPDPGPGNVLMLNMGIYASQRGAFPSVIDETFIVRQITAGSPATVTVEAFGFVQQYRNVAKVEAWAGSGKDTIRLEAGLNPADPEGDPVAFTLPAELHGGPDNDKLVAGDGHDILYGDEGKDKLVGRGGRDTLHGGAGQDGLDGGLDFDVLYGGPDNDSLTGGPGSDYLDGGAGDDSLEGGPGSDSAGQAEADLADILAGGAGNDTLRGHYGSDLVFGDATPPGCDAPAPEDFYDCYAALAAEVANPQDSGQDGDDSLDGAQGNDKMAGGGGNDHLAGGLGHDWLYGNAGQDALDGDDDNSGTPDGDDHLYGGPDADTLLGRGGHDLLEGGLGNDLLRGGEEADDLLGGEDSDALLGEAGDDIMLGDSGTISDSHTPGDHSAGRDTVLGLLTVDDLTGAGAVSCTLRVDVYGGLIDLDGDGVGGDTGQFEGYPLLAGGLDLDRNGAIDTSDSGTLGSAFVVAGLLDLDGDGQATDDGTLAGVGVFGASRGHADCMWGDVDNDYLFGGASSDVMFGDAGLDYMEGNRQGDIMRGGQDADEMYGNRRTENAYGDPDDDADTLYGDSGDDIMEGNQDVDTMRGGMGTDRMLGGSSEGGTPDSGDVMVGDGGPDIMLGDNGTISEDGQLIETIDPQIGGVDTMQGNREGDIMLGGAAGDDMWGNTGADIMVGDNGRVTRDGQAAVLRIETTAPGDGGVDTMEGNEEADIILGGMDGDQIYGNEDADTILGDNGVVVRADGSPEANDITTTDPQDGGSDTIEGNLGADLILGGSGGTDLPGTGLGDTISGNEGDDLVLGDNGYIMRDAGDVVEWFESREPLSGGQDTIYGNADNDIAFGGTISDTISGGSGHDILLGDHGRFDTSRPPNQNFLAIYTGAGDGGAGDTIHGDDGDDILLGQQGIDELYGDAGQDDLTGGHNVAGAADAGDVMFGESDDAPGEADGSGADVMLGDNGVISRTLTAAGTWEINLFNDSYKRVVQLFDVETLSDPEDVDAYAGAYGNDEMWGNDNDDLMWGQGGEDRMVGGAGDDYMEGNAASDLMVGDSLKYPLAVGGDDDMLGGTGPTTSDDPSTALPGRTDRSTRVRSVLSGTVSIDVPLGDEMYGGSGADVMLGDNGIVDRALDGNGYWVTLEYLLLADHLGGDPPRHPTNGPGARIDRLVQMVDAAADRVAGSDLIDGGPGDDDLYGQFDDTQGISLTLPISGTIGDEMAGGEGEDAMVGDQGVIGSYVVETPTEWLEPKEPFVADHIFVQDTLMRAVTLTQIPSGGDDLMTGGPGGDWMHGGAGADLMNGNDGNDRLFGDRGDDAIWGGLHHDHLWGGHGADYLDVRPRDDDPQAWRTFAETDHYQDIDYVYGGWDPDAMQANVADEGPVPGDRLIDWVGAYNIYYLCPGLYGEFVVTRALSPGLIRFLQRLAEGDGAVDTGIRNRSGYDEVAMVFPGDAGDNSHPVHSDNPGHFTCGEASTITPTLRSLSIGLSFKLKGSQAEVTGEVLVVDESEAAVPGATVTIDWVVPGGSVPVVQGAVTDKKGIASFMVPGGPGVYTLTVRDITLEGFVFDAERSQLTGSINAEEGVKTNTGGLGAERKIYLPVIIK